METYVPVCMRREKLKIIPEPRKSTNRNEQQGLNLEDDLVKTLFKLHATHLGPDFVGDVASSFGVHLEHDGSFFDPEAEKAMIIALLGVSLFTLDGP